MIELTDRDLHDLAIIEDDGLFAESDGIGRLDLRAGDGWLIDCYCDVAGEIAEEREG